ncbi:MAG: 2-oxoacid:acceptor oxidoreductase family protein [Bifidobacteriaceae bacterium]|jgi:pyruvate ferredoxin oxidoreductase gamma subunit|nr:2-oxoacid:acceptor oxidoreductase family protein [Bifidobacteriaceae bacterium]
MFQIVIHGRGGQGVVTASELLARSGFAAGFQVQAIPSFGSERMGAPVVAYTRISDARIITREPILNPDAVIIQDPTLLKTMNVFEGLDPDGWAVVNTRESPNEVRETSREAPRGNGHLATVPADDIVREYLGRPIPSAALLGAFAALTGQITLEALAASINHLFKGRVAAGNVNSANVAYQWVLDHRGLEDEGAHAGIAHVEVERPSTAELPIPIAGDPEVTNA